MKKAIASNYKFKSDANLSSEQVKHQVALSKQKKELEKKLQKAEELKKY